MTAISVIVATLGRERLLAANLRSIVEHSPPPAELIVVDGDDHGAARPAVDAVAASTRVPVRYVPSERGLCRQRNRGLEVASGDVVLFLDDDARMGPGVLDALAGAYRDPTVVGATGRVDEPGTNRIGGKSSPLRRVLFRQGREGRFTRYGYPRRLTDEGGTRDVEFMQGCFMSARRDLALQLGFDEHLAGYGLAEDEDFSYRLSRLGRIRYLGDVVVHHDNLGAQTMDRRAFGRTVVVNRHYLLRKNFGTNRGARLQFGGLVLVLFAHRLLNRDLAGFVGLVDGVQEVLGAHRA